MKNIEQGMQFKFFGSRGIYEMITDNRYRRYSRYGYRNRYERKSYLLTNGESKNIRSIFDPTIERQVEKRKKGQYVVLKQVRIRLKHIYEIILNMNTDLIFHRLIVLLLKSHSMMLHILIQMNLKKG